MSKKGDSTNSNHIDNKKIDQDSKDSRQENENDQQLQQSKPGTSFKTKSLNRRQSRNLKKMSDKLNNDSSDDDHHDDGGDESNEKVKSNNNDLELCHSNSYFHPCVMRQNSSSTTTSTATTQTTTATTLHNNFCQNKSTKTTSKTNDKYKIQLSSSTDSDEYSWNNPQTTSNNDKILPVNQPQFPLVLPFIPQQSSLIQTTSSSSKAIGNNGNSNNNNKIRSTCSSSMPDNMNFLNRCMFHSNFETIGRLNNYLNMKNSNNDSNTCNMIDSVTYNSSSSSNICRTAHHHHHHHHHHSQPQHNRYNNPTLREIIEASSKSLNNGQQQNDSIISMTTKNNKDNSNNNNFEMSSIQATKIISNHSQSENNHITNANSNSSSAITTLTSSSSGLPVTALTAMELPKLSANNNNNNRSYNWQAYTNTLKDRMATIFNRDILADVYFLVGKKSITRFSAHKFVLSIGSAVFDAMFNGLLAKTNNSKNKDSEGGKKENNSNENIMEIELPDIEPEAFQALLRFLYLDEVDIGPETVMATLYAAKKYEVLALEVACVNFLKANLNPENAFMLLTQARLFDESNLADLCLEAIDKHTMNALQSDYFLEIDIDTLKMVIGRDTLRVREASLFTAVIKWTESECQRRNLELNAENKRQILSDALYLLRFPLMTIEEFAMNVAQSGLLTDKEIVNLFLYYTVETKTSIPFSFEPRCCITSEEYSVNRFQRTESRWGYSGTRDRIRFLTDRPIFVIGFGLYGSIQGQSEYEVVIEIIHTGSGKPLASNTTTFFSDGTDSTFKVMFQYPVQISQNTNYTACATLKGVDSYYGTNGCRTLTVNLGKGHSTGNGNNNNSNNNDKDTVTFQFSYAAGCNNGTSVEDGQIPEIIFCV